MGNLKWFKKYKEDPIYFMFLPGFELLGWFERQDKEGSGLALGLLLSPLLTLWILIFGFPCVFVQLGKDIYQDLIK